MPAEQRIIGGGLLMVGVVIVLVLIFLFTRTTVNAPDAHQEIVSKHWPAYMKARDQDSYLGVKNAAEEILRVLDEADRVAVVKLIKADATTDREVRQLQKLIESGGLEKNVDGLFEFEREWYVEKSHRALRQLSTAIDGVKVVKEIRTAARDTRSAIDEIRLGSGLPLEPAPAGTVSAPSNVEEPARSTLAPPRTVSDAALATLPEPVPVTPTCTCRSPA